ncbi:MAG: hypothetical protein CVT85_06895 [Alphaproteobacteria bacterium HGW-Alphaproteobacteria-7]|nr:MAG: hypothetical protein CVT85_06895 [Alphaproteobacteria bacterium HGW-Alphaproteobacteria-7]
MLAIAPIDYALPDLLIGKILNPASNEVAVCPFPVPTFPQCQKMAHSCRDSDAFLIWQHVPFRLGINPYLRIGAEQRV